MKKHLKRIMALVIAMVMVVGMSTIAFADTTTTTKTSDGTTTTTTAAASESFTMTIGVGNTNTSVEHTYQAYQIFDGDLLIEIDQTASPATTTKTLSNIVWGSGVSTTNKVDGKTLIEALAENTNFTGVESAADVAEKLSGKADDAEIAQVFADIVSKYLTTPKASSTATKADGKVTGYSITGLEAGYYLVKDQDTSETAKDDFYTRFVLEVVSDVTAAPKGESPSVDKEVLDDESEDTAINDGWSDAADHELYETFKFRLTATIPANVDLAKYDYYKVVFTDTMSAGISFESIDSVKIKVGTGSYGEDLKADILDATKTVTVGESTLQKLVASDNVLNSGKTAYQQLDATTAAQEWTLTFNDLKSYLQTADLSKDITIQVVYNAHLNENATAFNANVTNDATAANNKTKLTFSNNPNAGGEGNTGETPDDTVWVFTYKAENVKYKDSATSGNEFGGAGFTLYDSSNNVVALYYDSTKEAYRPLKNNTEVGGYTYDATTKTYTAATASTPAADIKAYMYSADSTGKFNIIGLDEGTYKLVETVVPAGYNKCDDITITIAATTVENTSTAGADLTLTSTETTPSNLSNSIINKSGTVLPSTGGMGTTIFYIIGAILVVGAGVVLITRRRMQAEK